MIVDTSMYPAFIRPTLVQIDNLTSVGITGE